MTRNTIAAVVVTFNRKVLLCECLDSLLKQSQVLDAIFVIDNASSDGTQELLTEGGYLDGGRIEYLRLAKNTGGAGGFHAGMSAAYKMGYDWIWLMDDDTEPHLDALKKMQPCMEYAGVVAVANRKLDREGKETGDGLRFFARKSAQQYPTVRFSSFVGLLVSRKAIEQVGFPRPEFFIHDDDTEYCMRLRSIGNIALAADSFVAHKEIARQEPKIKIFGHTFRQQSIYQFCFTYFRHRNFASILTHSCGNPILRYGRLAGRFVCFAGAVIMFDRDHRWLRIKVLAKANWDGMRGHFDNSYPFRLREGFTRNASTST